METVKSAPSFMTRIFELLDRVEYRRIQSAEDMEAVGRIRARAYKENNIMPVSSDLIIDEADFDPQAYVFGVFYDEQLISTIRIHHVTPDHRVSSAAKVFPDVVNEFLDAGMTLIDPTRLASDAEAFQELPGMHLLTMRLAVLATEYFDADRCLSLVSPQHAAFYRRMIESRVVIPATTDTGVYSIPLTLLASNLRDARTRVYRRLPFLHARPYEMRMLFGPLGEFTSAPLTILPTARHASDFGRLPRIAAVQEGVAAEAGLQ